MLRLHQGGAQAVAEASDVHCNTAMGEQSPSDLKGHFSPRNLFPSASLKAVQQGTSTPFSSMGKLSHEGNPWDGHTPPLHQLHHK